MRRPWKFVLARLVAVACLLLAHAVFAAETGKMMSISYTPSGIKTQAEMEKGISEERLRADLKRLVPYTRSVRIYSLEYGLDRVPAIARELGLKVSLGIWLERDAAKNAAHIKKAVAVIAADHDVIERIFVGNEAIVRGDLTAAQVAGYIRQVRDATHTIIPMGTAEPWHVWLKNKELATASDFIGAHLFGYWDGVAVIDAVNYTVGRYNELQAAFPAKPIVVAETGWPTGGAVQQAAAPSMAARAGFVREFLRRARANLYDYNVFEAYDQPWKAGDEKGALWGILADDGTPRFNFYNFQ